MRGLIVITFLLLGTTPMLAQQTSPYAGQQHRPLKALSEAEVKGFLNGEGMGFARVAELNHYPGPRHVLDLAESLELTAEQLRQAEELFDRMREEAVRLGTEIVAKETELERLFADQRIDEESLHRLLREIGGLRAELRGVHLRAHLAMRAVLSEDQIAHYDLLRGYSGEVDHSHHH